MQTIFVLDGHSNRKLLHLFVINVSILSDLDFTILRYSHIRTRFSHFVNQLTIAIRVSGLDDTHKNAFLGIFIDTEFRARDFWNFRQILKRNRELFLSLEFRITRLIPIRQGDNQFKRALFFGFVVEFALGLDLAVFRNFEQIHIAADNGKDIVAECICSIQIIGEQLTNDVRSLVFVEREVHRTRNNRHFVHINDIDSLLDFSSLVIRIHHGDNHIVFVSNRFVVQLGTVLHSQANFVLGAVLLELCIKETVGIRIASILHERNQRSDLALILVFDFVACDFVTSRGVVVIRIFLDIVTLLAIIDNHRLIRVVNELDGHKRRSRFVIETLILTIVGCFRPNFIYVLCFVIYSSIQVNLSSFCINLKDFRILGISHVIRKGVSELAPSIFIIGNNGADKLTLRSTFMNFEHIFLLFVSRNIVHIVNLDSHVNVARKSLVRAICCNDTDRVFFLLFIVQAEYILAFFLALFISHRNFSVIINRELLVIVCCDVRCSKRVSRHLASCNMRILAIIISSNDRTNVRTLLRVFINSESRRILERRRFRHIRNIDNYINFLRELLVRYDSLELVRRLGFVVKLGVIDSEEFTRACIDIELGSFIAFEREIERSEISIVEIRIRSLDNTKRSGLSRIFSNCKRIRLSHSRFFVHVNYANLGILGSLIPFYIRYRQGNVKEGILIGSLVESFIIDIILSLDDKFAQKICTCRTFLNNFEELSCITSRSRIFIRDSNFQFADISSIFIINDNLVAGQYRANLNIFFGFIKV